MSSKILTRCMVFGMILLLAAAAPVYAGFGGSATPDFPDVVQVGTLGVNVGLDLLPVITGGDTGPVLLVGITMIPSCGLRTGTGTCASAEWDPGVFTVSATGTGADSCTGIGFTITETDPSSGEVTFTPDTDVLLDHLQNCRINFTVDVDQFPTDDSNAVMTGVQTAQEAKFAMTQASVQVGTGSGSDETTVNGCGDEVIDAALGETCDPPGQPGPGPQPGECRNGGTEFQCTYCGDGILQAGAGEECDDGNGVNFDGCNNDCLIETCNVLVDKNVDCGTGAVDMTLVSANEDGTNGCSANNLDPVDVGYQVQNTGNVDLVNCTLVDSNGNIIAPSPIGTVGVGITSSYDPTNEPLICSDALEAGEPDTITVVCDCGAAASVLGTATATDEATFECLPICGDGTVDPALGETCDPPGSAAGGNGNLCRDDCTVCGDGVVDAGEECDDGNGVNFDGCNNNCEIETCNVLVDKNVNCGTGAVDMTLVSANEDGTNGCSADNGDTIIVGYQVQNTGNVDLVECTLTDSNGNIIAPGAIGTVGVGATSPYGPTNAPLICSDALELGEPDTVTVSCSCGALGSGLGTRSATDEATFECLPICGDGTVDAALGETCDPPGSLVAPVGGGAADRECRNTSGTTPPACTYCGDGVVQAGTGEECDDGNGVNFDGCNNDCLIETCNVLVDKNVDCGTGAVDMTLVSANEDGTNGCSANNLDPVDVGYQVQNTGNVDLVNCTLVDSNGNIIAPSPIGTVGVGITSSYDPTNEPLICSDALEAGEPDTITVVCDCGAPASGLGTATATDEATFECLPICGDSNIDPGETCDPPGQPGPGPQPGECRADCTYCGDGIVDVGEECDDGNGVNYDGCNNNCEIETCDVLVDKSVDCGTGPVDMTLVSGNEDGTNGCSADNGDTIIVGYQVQNTGNVDLVNCTLTDSNGAIIAPGAIGTVGVSVTTPVLDPTNTPLICSDALELGEPDTITVSCDCGAPASGLGTASATDEADIECLPICGDGTVDAALGETCDPPGSLVAPVGGGAADRECRNTSGTTPPACTYCGDGIVQPGTGEECDDGNDINNDACTNDCTIPCQVLIDKTVAPDNGCDGIPDGAFEDSVSQAAGECVIYSICVTNSGYQTLDTTGVEVSDTHLGVTSLNLGTIAPGVTECVEIATEAPADSCTGPEGACVCEDVEGVNTAVVTNAVCETTGDNACDRAGSDCDDTAEVSCIAEGCLLIIDEDGIDNGMYNIERAAPACGLSMGDNDYLVNDKDWLYDENFYNPMDPLLFPSDLLSECRANGLPYDRKLPTECGNPAFLWNLFVGDGMCGPEDGPGRLALLPTGQVDDEGYFALPPKHASGGIRYADERPGTCNKYIYGMGGTDGYDLFVEDFVRGVVPQECLDKVRDVMPLRNQDLAQLVGRTCVAVVYDSDINMDYEPIYANLQGERYGLFSFYVEAVEVAGSIPENKSDTSFYGLWLRILAPQEPGAGFPIVIHDHEPDACEAKARYSSYNGGTLKVIAWSDFPGAGTGPGDPEDWKSYMTVSIDGYDHGTDWTVVPFRLEEPMTYKGRGRYQYKLMPVGENLRGRRLSVQSDEGCAYNIRVNY